MKLYIKGSFRKKIYSSASGYTVGLFKVRETNDKKIEDFVNKTITFTGFFHELNPDYKYVFYGKMIEHDKYGYQYQVDQYDVVKPEGKEGLIMFLSSNLFPGVGEKMASRIVEKLGIDALEKIKNDVNVLKSIKGITAKKRDKIYNILIKYEKSEKIIVKLGDFGFSIKEALLIYKKYEIEAINIIENNLYDLMELIPFLKLDKLKNNFDIKNDDKRRVKALILYLLDELTFKNGDTYLSLIDIVFGLNEMFNVYLEEDLLEKYLLELNSEYKVVIVEDKYYLRKYYLAEKNVVDFFLTKEEEKIEKDLDLLIKNLEDKKNIVYNEEQKKAMKMAVKEKVSIITGGPGTGKTTIINAIVDLFQAINEYDYDYDTLQNKIALIAPTGRAAKRMCSSSLMGAMTIHRFLKWNKETDSFSINEYNKSEVDFVIVDEVSMIDSLLLNNLILGLKSNVKIVMVGDYNQLPSVAPGQVLKDLIESKVVPTVILKKLYRQEEGSYISLLADNFRQCNYQIDEGNEDFKFVEVGNSIVRSTIVSICDKALKKGYTIKDIQVLCPMYRGENGIDMLNKVLQKVFNKKESQEEYLSGGVLYREGDKVLQLVNLPDENVYNGDIGFIKSITKVAKKTEIVIDFDGNFVKYYPRDLINIKHAYAISIHKSQGSEFKIVVMPVVNSYRRMLYKKLLYTGITRAKKSLIIVGDKKVFQNALKNEELKVRRTSLKDMLINAKK